MTDNHRFDAALRARPLHRPAREESEPTRERDDPHRRPANRPAAPASPPAPPKIASELEASLVRDLNALAAGLRPAPKKLLPDPASAPPPSPAAASAEKSPSGTKPPPARQSSEAAVASVTDAGQAKATDGKPRSPYAPPAKPVLGASAAAVSAGNGGRMVRAAPAVEKPASPHAPLARPTPGAPPGAASATTGPPASEESTPPQALPAKELASASVAAAGAENSGGSAAARFAAEKPVSPDAPSAKTVRSAVLTAVPAGPVDDQANGKRVVSPYAPPSRSTPPKAPDAMVGASTRDALPTSEGPLSPYAPRPRGKSQDVRTPLPAERPAEIAGGGQQDGHSTPPRRPRYPGDIGPPLDRTLLEPDLPAAVADLPGVSSTRPALPSAEKGDVGAQVLGEAASTDKPVNPERVEPEEAAEDPIDSPSPEELAKLYAPAAYARARVASVVAADAAEGRSQPLDGPYAQRRVRSRIAAATAGSPAASASAFAPRTAQRTGATGNDGGGKARPIRWRARDEMPLGSRLAWGGGVSWRGKAAAALVLIALIGGAAGVVTLESLSVPEPDSSMAAVDRSFSGTASDTTKLRPTKRPTGAGKVPADGVEIVSADDAGNGLAPSEGSPLPRSAKVIPLPQAVVRAGDRGLRPTRDAAGVDDPALVGAPKAVAVAPPDNGGSLTRTGSRSGDGASAAAGGVTVDAGGAAAGRDSAPADGVLAYAPAPELIDRGAKALAKKGDHKTAAKAGSDLSSGSVRVTAWVNMRASADNNAATIKVLQAGSIVTVVQCKFWCEIVSEGKHGYVYKRFLASSDQNASSQ